MSENRSGFVGALVGAFRYAFLGDGAFVIGTGVVVFAIADFVSAFAGIAGLLLQLVIAGYLAAYAKDVVRTSAMGEAEPPRWLDLTDWIEDVFVPVLEFVVVAALAFGFYVFLQYRPLSDETARFWANMCALVWGCLTFPLLFLAVAMTDSIAAAFNPLPLLRAVGLTWRTYFLTCLFCVLIYGLDFGAETLLSFAGRIPILPRLMGWLVTLYLLTTAMRSIGLFYRHNHEQLEWY